MGIKHPRPHKSIEHKTHHQTGYRKPVKNPTTNAAPDTHTKFCARCFARNGNKYCPKQGMGACDI